MEKVIVSIGNKLLSEAIAEALDKNGNFKSFTIATKKTGEMMKDITVIKPKILLFGISFSKYSTFEEALELIKRIRVERPECKICVLCDYNAQPDVVKKVIEEKSKNNIDVFLFTSVTTDYMISSMLSLL